VVFLVADADQVERMIEVAQRYKAIQRIITEPDRLAEFNKEQVGKLKKMAEAAELDLRVAITKAYRHLYYPRPTPPASRATWRITSSNPATKGKSRPIRRPSS
jgi:hypothetical protein